MMDQKIIDAAAKAFSELDFAEENAKIGELEGQIAAKHAAVSTADDRVQAINRELSDYRGPSGRDVADALLASRSASDAALASPDTESMKTERASLQAGIRQLNRDVEDLRIEIQKVQGTAHGRAIEAAEPLINEITAFARANGERILTAFAALKSVSHAVSRFGLLNDVSPLENAVEGLMGQRNLIEYRKTFAVPAEIVEALRSLERKGPALRVGISETVGKM